MNHLQEKHGCTLLGSTPPGTCPECTVAHPEEQPRNKESLCYQCKFYDKHGRWPSWSDAMAHCPPEVQTVWIEALKERGINIEEE